MKVDFTRRVNVERYIVFIWYEVVYFRKINICLQVKNMLRGLTIIIISKANVSVSKYKQLNNNQYLCNNCFFLQCRLEFVKQLRIHYGLTGVRSRFDIINLSQCHSHICQDVGQKESVYFQLILNDVKHSLEVLHVFESQADVLFIEIQSSDPVASLRVQSKIAQLAPVLLVATHGLAYPRQTFCHLLDLPIVENEDGRAVLFMDTNSTKG